jgi:tetratricopeptide (TPR) repeat protein
MSNEAQIRMTYTRTANHPKRFLAELRRMVAAGAAFLACACSVIAFEGPPPERLAEAQKELFADRFENASSLYSKLVGEQPEQSDAWYGLVRAEIAAHHSSQAYAAAEQALAKAPQTAGAETAAGLAMFRRGNFSSAESHFRAALAIKPDYPGALEGMASLYYAVSRAKTGQDLLLRAFRHAPDDPRLMLAYANTLKGPEHIAALDAVLAKLDPAAEQARNLRAHIANDRALGDRKLRRLVSPYESSRIKLSLIRNGPDHPRGWGLRLMLNQKESVKLLLDTGASGIAVSPKLAEKAGLQVISGESSDAKGIGDKNPLSQISYLASEIRAGDVVFADYPVSVFRNAQSADFDGLIGADVFARFLIKIDFPKLELSLEPRPRNPDIGGDAGPVDAVPPAPGFFRVYRVGNHLAVPTNIEGGRTGVHAALFLLDSGSSANLIDTETAREATSVSSDSRIIVKGIQGKVDKTSLTNQVSLLFAGFKQENPSLIAISLEKMSDSMGIGFGGLLGMPVLANLAVTIDYREGTVKMEYKKP